MIRQVRILGHRLWSARWMGLTALVLTVAGMHAAVSCGHDYDFHLVSWLNVIRAWHQGVLLPEWAQTPAWQAGEPRFVFYPPLSWLLGAALGAVLGAGAQGWTAQGWTLATWGFVWLALVATGMATRRLAREWLPDDLASVAGILAILAPYALFTAFERSALAELAATPCFPLAILYSVKSCAGSGTPTLADQAGQGTAGIWSPATRRLAVVIAACWLLNAPSGVMLCYMLAGVALVVAALERAVWPVGRALLGVLLGLGLAAFYLVPAALEQRWVQIDAANAVGMRIEDSWLFARHAAPELAFHDAVLHRASIIFLLTVLVASLACWLAYRSGALHRRDRRFWLPLLLLLPAALGMQLPPSQFLWHLLPKMQFLQFPWRLTIVLTAPLAIFLALALKLCSRRQRGCVLCVGVLLAAGASFLLLHQPCDSEDNVAAQLVVDQQQGAPPTDEYTPTAADNAELAVGLPAGCLLADPLQPLGTVDDEGQRQWSEAGNPCLASARVLGWNGAHMTLDMQAPRAGYLVLRLRRFPAWHLSVNGLPAVEAAQRDDGLIVLAVAQGANRIDLQWMRTPERIWGSRISLLALLILLAGAWIDRRSIAEPMHALH